MLTWTKCTTANIDSIDALLPKDVWADKVASEALVIEPACPWGPCIGEALPLRHVMIIEGGEYDGESIRVRYPFRCFSHLCTIARRSRSTAARSTARRSLARTPLARSHAARSIARRSVHVRTHAGILRSCERFR